MNLNRTKKIITAFSAFATASVFFFAATKANAENVDWNSVLQQLDNLQVQAENFLQQSATGDGRTSQELVFAYLRGTRYNNDVWALMNRQSDSNFESYVQQNAPQLAELQTIQSVILPATGEEIDFGHLMASCGLAGDGLAVPGSWGGDCMELAETTLGSSADLSALMAQQAQTFNSEAQSLSVFSAQDLRADMDAVNLAALLNENNGTIANLLQKYYQDIDAGSRVLYFAQNQFGECDLSRQSDFREQVYTTLIDDGGMQLLLALQDMWNTDQWQVETGAELSLRASAYLLADYIAETAPQKKIQSVPKGTQKPDDLYASESMPEIAPVQNMEENLVAQKQAKMILVAIAGAAILCGAVFIVMLIKIVKSGRR